MIFRRRGPKPPIIDKSQDAPAASPNSVKQQDPVIIRKKRADVPMQDFSDVEVDPKILKAAEELNAASPAGVLLRKKRTDVEVQDYTIDEKAKAKKAAEEKNQAQNKIEQAETLVEFLHPVNKLKKKVGEGASNFDPGVFVKANEVIKGLAMSYIEGIAPKELREIGYTLQSLEHFPDKSRETIAKMFNQAHDIKSGGGSYGYPLVSRIAESLCKLTEGMSVPEEVDIGLIKFHVDALNIVVRKKIKGIGGEIGQLLAEGLEVIVAKRKAHDPSLVMGNISKFLEKLDGA